MTAVAEGRERATLVAQSNTASPVPGSLSDQANDASVPQRVAPGSDLNGQQPALPANPEGVSATGSNGQGQPSARPEPTPWAAAPAWHELRVFAELYADVQQTRIACANRAERGGLDPMVLASQLAGLKDSEHQLGLALVRCYRRVVPAPIREWQKATPGIGEHLLARLLGAIGDPRWATPYHWESPDGAGSIPESISDAPRRVLVADPPFERNVAKLWAYCGHGDPTRRRRKGMTAEDGAALGNPRAKMLVHLLAEAAMKCVGSDAQSPAEPSVNPRPSRARSPYRDAYEQGRVTYVDRLDDDGKPWTPAHQHAAALRLVGKEILRDLWLAAGDQAPSDVRLTPVPGGPIASDTQPTTAAGEQNP